MKCNLYCYTTLVMEAPSKQLAYLIVCRKGLNNFAHIKIYKNRFIVSKLGIKNKFHDHFIKKLLLGRDVSSPLSTLQYVWLICR